MNGSSKVIDPMVPVTKKQNITRDKILKMLPRGSKHEVTDEIMRMIERLEDDTDIEQSYMEEAVLSHMSVLNSVKTNLKTYIDAVKYCNLTQHMTNEKAWIIVFPDRYLALQARGRDISSDVSMWNGRPIVAKIKALMITAVSIQYAPEFHEAMATQVKLMRGEANGLDRYGKKQYSTAMVQHLAAKTIMEMAKPPEEAEKLEISIDKGSIIDDYEKAFSMAAMAKLNAIENGANLVDAINAPVRIKEDVVDAEVEEIKQEIANVENTVDVLSTSGGFDPLIHDEYIWIEYGEIRKKKVKEQAVSEGNFCE